MQIGDNDDVHPSNEARVPAASIIREIPQEHHEVLE